MKAKQKTVKFPSFFFFFFFFFLLSIYGVTSRFVKRPDIDHLLFFLDFIYYVHEYGKTFCFDKDEKYF